VGLDDGAGSRYEPLNTHWRPPIAGHHVVGSASGRLRAV